MCQETLAGSKYDRFWVESMEKRLNTLEKVNELMEVLQKIRDSDSDNKVAMFKEVIDEMWDPEKERRE